jgi:hypothetical protein
MGDAMIFRALAALAALLSMVLPAMPQASAQERVYYSHSWASHDLSYTDCTSRAKTAIANAARIFGLAGGPQNFGFFVGLEWDGSAVVNVHCLASLDTRAPADLDAVGPMLTGIVVSTTRPIDINLLLHTLDECVNRGNCEGGPLAGAWSHPDVFGELTLVGGPDSYSGSYSMRCAGSEKAHGFVRQLRKTMAGSFAGTFGDDVCEGKIENVKIPADGRLHADVLWDKRPSGPVSSKIVLTRLR